MDDQNQNNNPLSEVSSPPEPSVEPTATTPVEPLPIVEEPVPPAPLGSLTPEPSLGTSSIVPSLGTSPTESPVSVPSVGVDMSTPTEPQPKVVAVESDVPQTPPVFSQNTAPVGTALSPEPMTDSPMPEAKPKNKAFSAVMGVAALLLVVGVAGAAYYVSNQLSTRQAVAPTAPESKPLAVCRIGDVTPTLPEGRCPDGYDGCSEGCCCGEGGGETPTCDTSKRDTQMSKSVTFNKAGKVILFTRKLNGVITLTGTNQTVNITSTNSGNAVKQTDTFKVDANETYTIKVKLANETKDAYGWILNKAATVCGPKNSVCGDDVSIAPLVSLATGESDVSGVTVGGKVANTQCWGDAPQSDSTQDYDYNDFTLIFGYEKETVPSVGVCSMLQIYLKKSDGTYESTALTSAQLKELAVGDQLKLQVKGSLDNLKARFRISVEGSAGEWVSGVIDENDKKMSSYSYTVNKAGTYKFEAQVSTAP